MAKRICDVCGKDIIDGVCTGCEQDALECTCIPEEEPGQIRRSVRLEEAEEAEEEEEGGVFLFIQDTVWDAMLGSPDVPRRKAGTQSHRDLTYDLRLFRPSRAFASLHSMFRGHPRHQLTPPVYSFLRPFGPFNRNTWFRSNNKLHLCYQYRIIFSISFCAFWAGCVIGVYLFRGLAF